MEFEFTPLGLEALCGSAVTTYKTWELGSGGSNRGAV